MARIHNNNDRFVEAANEFLWGRGYSKHNYFIGGKTIDFYPERFNKYGETKIIHPNGKIFSTDVFYKENYLKYKKWMCELILPIMLKYGITIGDIR